MEKDKSLDVRGRWQWPTVRCNLRQDQVPSCYREPFIRSRYRSCRSPLSSCLLSALYPSNETLNFWTHFVPSLVLAYVAFRHHSDLSFTLDPFHWPFLVFLFSSFLYLIASALAHLFCCYSEVAFYICYFIDFSAITVYMVGHAIAINAYLLPQILPNSLFHRVYLPTALVLSVLTAAASYQSRLSKHRTMRIHGRKLVFPIFYIWNSLPVCYRIIFGSLASTSAPYSSSSTDTYYVLQMLFPILACLTYGAHAPECLAPGRFDLFASSHQLFHIIAAARTYFQYMALKTEMETMRMDIVAVSGVPTFGGTFGYLTIKMCAEILMILTVSRWLQKPYQLIRIKKIQGIRTLDIDEKYN